MIENARTKVLWLMIVLTIVFAVLTVVHSIWWLIGRRHRGVARRSLGLYDFTQTKHSILRNYPIVGRMPGSCSRTPGPSCTSTSSRTTPRAVRSTATPGRLMYQRAKNVPDKKPFGTELDVYAEGYTWMMHSVAPHPMPEDPVAAPPGHRRRPACTQPYSLSVLNISAMSFGALGSAAVTAMNTGAKLGQLRPRHRRGRPVQVPPRSRAAT